MRLDLDKIAKFGRDGPRRHKVTIATNPGLPWTIYCYLSMKNWSFCFLPLNFSSVSIYKSIHVSDSLGVTLTYPPDRLKKTTLQQGIIINVVVNNHDLFLNPNPTKNNDK